MATNIKRKSTAHGSKFSYKYTDLATIHEELDNQNITYYQYTDFDEKAQADYIYTVLKYNDGVERKPLRGVKIVDGKTLSGGNNAQEYGSALTYARRYSLLMALGWATEDDDAAGVGSDQQQPAQQAQSQAEGRLDRLDFDTVKAELLKLNTEEEVNAAKENLLAKYPNMTEKQRGAINRIFADRIDHITYGDQLPHWHDAK